MEREYSFECDGFAFSLKLTTHYLHSAAFANAPSGLFCACFYIVVMGGVFGYYFLLIGKTADLTFGAFTFREIWQETMGTTGSFWVSLCNMLKPALANLAYVSIMCMHVLFVELASLFRIMTISFSHASHPSIKYNHRA